MIAESSTKRRPWNWRRNLLYSTVTLTEAFWLAPMIMWLLILFDDPMPMPLNHWTSVVIAVLGTGMVLQRILRRRDITNQQQGLIFIAAIILLLFLTISLLPILMEEDDTPTFDFGAAFDLSGELIPNGIILIPFIFMLFLRGTTLGRLQLTHVGVGLLVRLAILMFFLTSVLALLPVGERADELSEDMLPLLPVLFFVSLLAGALARAVNLKIDEEVRDKRFNLSWMGFLTITVTTLTGLGFVVSILLAGIDREKALAVMGFPLTVIAAILFIITAPLLYVAEEFTTWLQDVLADDPPPDEIEVITGEREVVASSDNPQLEIGDLLTDVIDFVTNSIGIICLVSIVAIIAFFWLSMLFGRDRELENDEASERIDRRESLRRAFLNQFRKIGDALGLVRRFGVGRDLFAAFTIRWAYARMERMGRRRGFPRTKSETPYEYRRQLLQAFPGGENHIKIITEAYVGIRYGELPENENKLQAVRSALDNLKEIPAP